MINCDLKELIQIQTQLNDHIKQTQNLSWNDTKEKSHLCIIIELMELCNATRCFNYWSKKTRATDDVILEEFADVVCFLLTELINSDIYEIKIDDTIKSEDNLKLTLRFHELVCLYTKLDLSVKSSYIEFASKLFELGYALGYSWMQIKDAYIKKVLKNHKIQDEFNK